MKKNHDNFKVGRIMIVDDEAELMTALCEALAGQGYETTGFTTGADALKILVEQDYDLLLTDLMMPEMDGIALLKAGLEIDPNLVGIIMTGHGTVQTAVEALKKGAFDYVLKPFKLNSLLPLLSRAMEVRSLRMENIQLRETVAIHELGKAIAFSTNLNAILNKVADATLQQCNADEVSIMLPTRDGQELYIAVARGGHKEYIGERVPMERGIAGWVATHRETVVINGNVDDQRFSPIHPRNDINAAVSMPMLSGGNLVGVLNVNVTKSHRHMTLGQVKALSILVSIISPILENTWLNIQIRQAEEKYRSLLDNASDAIFLANMEGNLQEANKKAEEILGYSREEISGIHISRIHPAEVFGKIKDIFNEIITKGSGYVNDVSVLRKDGEIIPVDITGSLIEQAGTKVIQSIFRDITERKRAEGALKESENKYRLLADNVNDVIFILDLNLNYTYVSPSVKILRGYEPEEVLKQLPTETLTPSSMDLAIRTLSEIMELEKSGHRDTNLSRTLQLEMVRKDGTTVWTEVKFSFIRDENQQMVGILGVTRDITERKQAEEELKQSEERYRSIFENAQEGIFRSTPDGRIITSNQAMANMFGYESTEERKMMTSITDMARQHYVNPEDLRIFEETIKEQGFITEYEAQNYRKDESIIWISLTMHAVRDEKGRIMYYDGIILDITNHKESTERTKKALGATVQAIAVTVETRDPYTAGHQRRVADLARAIATEMNLPTEQIDGIRMAAAIHDLGKISVPAEILSKPTKLTNLEFSLIKTHAQSGYDILKDIEFPWPIARMVLEHHERMNGSGYPNGLTGDNILLESGILMVADVVEAMASHRPYRPSRGIEAALEEIEKNKGTLYDAAAVDACLRLFREKGYQLQ
jgi:PAS domain S-box-containing protein